MLFLQAILAGAALCYLLHGKSFLLSIADHDSKLNSTASKIFLHPLDSLGNSLAEKSLIFLSKNIIPVVSSGIS